MSGVLPPLPADEWGDAEYEAFGTLLGIPGEKVPRAGSGHRFDPLDFDVVGVLVRHPELAKAFLGFNGYLLQRSELPARLRELVVLRVAHRQQSAYEWAEHVRAAVEIGITADEIDRLVAGNEGFAGDDLLVLDAADEMLTTGRLAPASWEQLRRRLGTHQAMEVQFVIGTYQMLAALLTTWGLVPPPGAAPLPPPPHDQ